MEQNPILDSYDSSSSDYIANNASTNPIRIFGEYLGSTFEYELMVIGSAPGLVWNFGILISWNERDMKIFKLRI